MQLSARPLLGTAADLALFTGREAASARIRRALRTGLNCVVVGDPGAGKTSLVRVALAVESRAGPPLHEVTVRAGPGSTAGTLLRAVSDGLVAGGELAAPAVPSGVAGDGPLALIARIREQVEASPARVVILVEDLTAAPGLHLFGALRDDLWTIDARWLATISSAQAPGLLRPPADVFFEVQIVLEPLTDDEAIDLLRRRTDAADDRWLRQLVAGAGGNPRRLIELARDLDPQTAGDVLDGYRARDRALASLSRPAQMLARELEALGAAAASDEQLLNRTGWTRARAVQVFGELEDSGLVTHRAESSGRGRPRKVYRLTPVSEFRPPGPAA